MNSTIIKQLKAIRKANKISQGEIARRIGTSWQSVSRIERQEHDVQLSTVEKIADALGYEITIKRKGG